MTRKEIVEEIKNRIAKGNVFSAIDLLKEYGKDMMKPYYILLIFPLFIACQAKPQPEIEDSTLAKIDSLFQHVDLSTPGYMVGVIKDSNYIINRGYGLANLEYTIPINASSAFNIASLSKQFTGACVALLMLEGKASMEDDIKKFIPDFPDYGYDIKLKHLIYMTSGINDYYHNPRKNGTDWSGLNFFDVDTAIMASMNNRELLYEPGKKWSYSNINYMLLTKVVEKISGIRFSEFAKQRLFDPLDMTDTFVNDDIFQVIPNRVNGYNHRDDENTGWLIESGYLLSKGTGFLQINRNSPHYGGSGIYTTMNDLKQWITNFQTKAFGGQEFYDLMHKTMKFDHDKSNDSFGLVAGDFNGHEIVWYEGGDWGFSSYIMRFPKNNIAIVCLSNLGTGNSRKYAHQIMDVLIEDKIIDL